MPPASDGHGTRRYIPWTIAATIGHLKREDRNYRLCLYNGFVPDTLHCS